MTLEEKIKIMENRRVELVGRQKDNHKIVRKIDRKIKNMKGVDSLND
ncbi:MAG: hypothetical protein ACLTBR_02940 [Anaerostipes sp.]